MSFRLTGLSTGTDWESIIRNIIKVERRPIDLEQVRKLKMEEKRDAWKDINTRLSSLQTKVSALKLASTFNAKTAATSNDKVVTASAGTDVAPGTYTVKVTTLAQAQQVRSDAKTSAGSTLSLTAGTITVGKKSDGSAATVNVTASDSLNSLAEKINQVSTTVRASVIQVATTDYRLILTAASTGVDYAFGSTNTGSVADGTSDALTSLGILGGTDTTPANGFKDANELAQAQNAVITVNGLQIQRNSNTISDAVTGLTLNLINEAPTENVTVTVSRNTGTAATAVQSFVDQYNSTYSFIKEKMGKDETTQRYGPLSADPTAQGILNQLRRLVTGAVTGVTGDLGNLQQVGVTTGKWGTAEQDLLVFDSTKLVDELNTSPNDVLELFGAKAVNVALTSNGATATASSTAAGNYNVADLINGQTTSTDWGNPGGGWKDATADTFPDWVEIAFGQSSTIDQLKIYTINSDTMSAASYGIKDFEVQYWNNGAWESLETITGSSVDRVTLDFTAVATDKVRINITDVNGVSPKESRLVELEVYQKNFGVAARLDSYLAGLTSSTGITASTRNALGKEVDQIAKRITKMEDRLTAKEERLFKQFENLEQTLSRLRQQGSWLQAQLQ